MEWTQEGTRHYSSDGRFMLSSLPQYGSSQDYFAIYEKIGECWMPLKTQSGRTMYRRSLHAAAKVCEARS